MKIGLHLHLVNLPCHVRLNLLKLRILGELANETSSPVLKSMLLEPIPALGFLLGPCDYSASARLSLCECLSQDVCVCVWASEYALHEVWCLCLYPYDSLRAESKTERGIRILKTSLGTSGCDWQETKGSLCSGNWQQKPDPAQYNPAQYSTEPANTGEKKKHQQQDCSPPPLPTYPDSWPILIIPQQSPWQHFLFLFFPFFFYKHCSELFHSFHFNISK